jgi:hypothetical protein
MFRSILKGSLLAASFCVIAISSNAHAKLTSGGLASSGDVNLVETSGGAVYAADKKAGATCPFAKKGDLNENTVLADAGSSATAVGGFSSGRTTVH